MSRNKVWSTPHHWSFKVPLLFHFPLRLKSHGTPCQETPSLMNVFDRICIFVFCWVVLSLGCVFTYLGDLLCSLSYFLFLLTSCSLAYFFPLDIMSAGHNWVAPCPVSKNSWQLLTVMVCTPTEDSSPLQRWTQWCSPPSSITHIPRHCHTYRSSAEWQYILWKKTT